MPGDVGRGGTSEATGLGNSGIKRIAIVPGSGRADGPAGKAAISEASFDVAAARGNRANAAASSHGSTSNRASAERTLSCIPLLSSPIDANRKSSNSDPSENTEPVRFISITESSCLYRTLSTGRTAWGTETACQPSRSTQTARGNSRSLSKKAACSLPRRGFGSPQTGVRETGAALVATLSRQCHFGHWRLPPYARREDNSYSAREVHDDKNEQNGSKNAATNIHLNLHRLLTWY